MKRLLAAASALALVAGLGLNAAAAPSPAPFTLAYDAYVEQMRKDWSIPGVAIAVVEDGKTTVHSYGLRQYDRAARITPDTLFGIASMSKTFIAGAIAKLAGEGKLSFDDPVIKHLPAFKVEDPWLTRQITLRDLMAHRTGLASYGDWPEEIAGMTEAQVVERMAVLDQAAPFREKPYYNSLTYVVLGQVIEKVSGKPWDQYLKEEIFAPAGMTRTYAHASDFVPAENVLPTGDGWSDGIKVGQDAVPPGVDVASPHVQWEAVFGGKLAFDKRELGEHLAHFHRTPIEPSQSIFSTASDLARWARLLMNNGEIDGRQVIAKAAVEDMRNAAIIRRGEFPLNWGEVFNDPEGGLRVVSYASGLRIFNYGGRHLFGHDGDELGYSSLMAIDPQRKLAIVALVNNFNTSNGAAQTLVQRTLDGLYQQDAVDWSALALAREKGFHEEGNKAFAQYFKVKGPERAPLQSFTGVFEHPFCGRLTVRVEKGVLIASTGPAYDIELKPLGDGAFHGQVRGPQGISLHVAFQAEGAGTPRTLTITHPYLHRPIVFQAVS